MEQFSENSDKMQIEKYHHLSLIFKQCWVLQKWFSVHVIPLKIKPQCLHFENPVSWWSQSLFCTQQISLLCCLLFSERTEVAGFCLCKVAPGLCFLGCPVNSVVCPAVSLGGSRSASRRCQHLAPDGLTCGGKRGTCWKCTGGLWGGDRDFPTAKARELPHVASWPSFDSFCLWLNLTAVASGLVDPSQGRLASVPLDSVLSAFSAVVKVAVWAASCRLGLPEPQTVE